VGAAHSATSEPLSIRFNPKTKNMFLNHLHQPLCSSV